MKLSVMKNTGRGGGLSLPIGDEQGQYIAKFPSPNLVGLSENEFAVLALSEILGMDVPERELVENPISKEFPKNSTHCRPASLAGEAFRPWTQRYPNSHRRFRSDLWPPAIQKVR
jgi:serine/threonine-protein kinase HipA